MKITHLLVSASIIVFSAAAFAEGKAAQGADAQAIDKACTADAQTAGCGNEQVGTGLLKCLNKYENANKSFKVSDGCEAARKKGREDWKEKRAEKRAKKEAGKTN